MSEILKALDEEQRAAATCVSGSVVILAGAGTGKTRTITHRLAHAIKHGVVDAQNSLTVTFTNRAAGEVRSRLSELGVLGANVRTFHSAALRQLRYFYPQVFDRNLPTLVTSKSMFVAQAAQLCHLSTDTDLIRDLASEIEWAKVNIMSPDAYRQFASASRPPIADDVSSEQVAHVYETYLKVLDEAGCIDFEDVLLLTTALLDNYPELAATVHSQYRYFTVDEFQDVSPVQFELLRLWLGNRSDVCVVGDPAQTIYSFTGATSKYLLQFDHHFPNVQTFELTHSYRSTPEIIEIANRVLAKDEQSSLRLIPTKPSGAAVDVNVYVDDEDESKAVTQQILQLISQGVQAKDIAILFRSNFQSEPLEEHLADAGIPFSIRGSARFFERQEVKNAILHLRASTNVTNERPLGEFVRDIFSGIGWAGQAPTGGLSARETWQSLNTIVELADDFEAANNKAILPEFIAYLDERHEHDFDPQGNVVTLASTHAAKGLEWDTVFVVGLSDGLFPISYAQTPNQIAEERRLFFVAVSRAKNRLKLSWAKARRNSTQGQRTVSMFLSEVQAASAKQ